MDPPAASSLRSSVLLRLLVPFFCFRTLLHRSLQLHLQGNRRTSASRRDPPNPGGGGLTCRGSFALEPRSVGENHGLKIFSQMT